MTKPGHFWFQLAGDVEVDVDQEPHGLVDQAAYERHFHTSYIATVGIASGRAQEWLARAEEAAQAAEEAGVEPPVPEEFPEDAYPRVEWLIFFAWLTARRHGAKVPAKFDAFLEAVVDYRYDPPEDDDATPDVDDETSSNVVALGGSLDPTETDQPQTRSRSSSSAG